MLSSPNFTELTHEDSAIHQSPLVRTAFITAKNWPYKRVVHTSMHFAVTNPHLGLMDPQNCVLASRFVPASMVLTCGLRCNYQSRPSEAREAWVYCQMVEMAFFKPFSSPYCWTYKSLTYGMGSRIIQRASWAKIFRVGMNHDSSLIRVGLGRGSIPIFLGWTQDDIKNCLRPDV